VYFLQVNKEIHTDKISDNLDFNALVFRYLENKQYNISIQFTPNDYNLNLN
jgi:hypothetical protein